VACKAEDTIKKSKEILCAAHNLKQPHDHKTPDDKVCRLTLRGVPALWLWTERG
jgi:CTD kinase subunit beta